MKYIHHYFLSIILITTINLHAADYKRDVVLAIWYNDIVFIQENTNQENVNQLVYGDSALHHAARLGRKDILNILIYNKKADMNILNIDGRTPLHHAAQFNHKDIAKILLQYGAHAATKDYNGTTPWLIALRAGAIEIVELLDHWEDVREVI